MAVLVMAPRFDLAECRDHTERRFLERLNARAERGEGYGDSWSHLSDHVIISIALSTRNVVTRTLRVDFFGSRLLLGDDDTHQFVTELDPAQPGVRVVAGCSPEELADIAADWLETESTASKTA